jgi:cytochrome b involved in lipid metabolism
MYRSIVIAVSIVVIAAAGLSYVYLHRQAPVSTVTPDASSTPVVTVSDEPAVGIPSVAPAPTPPGITMAELARHATAESCYTAIGGSVYDLTGWINRHPGGREAILSLCGTDGTAAFMNQHGGAKEQMDILATLRIGTLSE